MKGNANAAPTLLLGVPRSRVMLALFAYAAVVAIAFGLRETPSTRAIVVSLAFAAFTTVALSLNLRRAFTESAGRIGWTLISIAAVVAILFELALAAEAAFPALLTIPPALWLAQSVASNGALSIGLLVLPYGTESVRHRIRMASDALAFFIAAFLTFWVLGARQEILESSAPLLTRIEALVSFSFNALELGIVIYIGSRAMQRFRGPLGWFLLAFSALTVGTAVVTFGRVRGEPTVGSAGELLQLLAFPCFVLAPMARMPARLTWLSEASLGGDLLTYGPVLLSLVVVLPVTLASGASDLVLDAGVPLLACVLLFRQFLAVRDVRDLSQTLECRVRERTEALRRSEQALEQAQRLEAIGRVASSVAHDFNNVLHAIQLAAHVMEDDHQFIRSRQELDIITSATRTGTALVKQVLEFSKPDITNGAPSSVADSLRSLEWMRHQLLQRQIRYQVSLPAESLRVQLAATRLEQVLANLIANARDAVADGGSIRVSAEATWVDQTGQASELGVREGAYVRVTVTDDGTGIDEDTLPHIFEPYFTTKTDAAGTGIGLATCYSVVRRAGGTVTVRSRPGKGSTFDVLLPVGS